MLNCPLLSVPLKKTYEVDYSKALKKFVSETYGADQEKEVSSAIDEFNVLRGRLCSKFGERSDAVLELYSRYVDQLIALEPKAVVCVGGPISIHFKWQRAFERDPARKNITQQSSAYEKLCVLFNIGAVQTQLAEAQNRVTDDGLKQCSRYLQQAAGTFQFLREQIVSPSVSCQLGPDELHMELHGDLLAALSALMVAQAQDCLFVKARADKMKDALLVKLATETREMYAEFCKLAGPFREALPREWFAVTDTKRTLFGALSEFYAARVHKEEQEIGKALARLAQAQTTLAALAKSEGKQFANGEELNAVRSLLESVQKDNELVYHDKIADYRSLPALERAKVAKAMAPKFPLSASFRDLFEKIVPIRVHAAMKAFETRLNESAAAELRRLREATALLNSVFASLGLPAALEEVLDSASSKAQLESEPDLPDSVREKAKKVHEAGGIEAVRQLLSSIPDILEQNRAVLAEIARTMDEEESGDRKLRDQFGSKWTRTASDKLNASFRSEVTKYRTLLENASSADTIVRERYCKLEAVIELLSRSDDAIRDAMPKREDDATVNVKQLETLAASESVFKLKLLCDRAHALKTAREELEHDLATLAKSDPAINTTGAVSDMYNNMRSAFLAALQNDGTTIGDEEQLANNRMSDILRGYRELIQASLAEQEEVLGELQSVNNAFVEERDRVIGRKAPPTPDGLAPVNLRAAFLQNIHAGYDGYVELRANVQEGNKFYADLLQILLKLQQRVLDFCYGRKIEKEEALADLNASAARAPPDTPTPTPRITLGSVLTAPTASAPPPPPPVAPSAPLPTPPMQPAGPPPYPYSYPAAPVYAPYPTVTYPYTPSPSAYAAYAPPPSFPPYPQMAYAYPPQLQNPPAYPAPYPPTQPR